MTVVVMTVIVQVTAALWLSAVDIAVMSEVHTCYMTVVISVLMVIRILRVHNNNLNIIVIVASI